MAAVVVVVLSLLAWHENLLWVIYVLSNHVTVYLLEFQLPDQAKKGITNQNGERQKKKRNDMRKMRKERA